MASKDQRPSQRLGKSNPRRVKIITWTVALVLCGGGAIAAYRYTGTTEVEVPVARARRGEFIISVLTLIGVGVFKDLFGTPIVGTPIVANGTSAGGLITRRTSKRKKKYHSGRGV